MTIQSSFGIVAYGTRFGLLEAEIQPRIGLRVRIHLPQEVQGHDD